MRLDPGNTFFFPGQLLESSKQIFSSRFWWWTQRTWKTNFWVRWDFCPLILSQSDDLKMQNFHPIKSQYMEKQPWKMSLSVAIAILLALVHHVAGSRARIFSYSNISWALREKNLYSIVRRTQIQMMALHLLVVWPWAPKLLSLNLCFLMN